MKNFFISLGLWFCIVAFYSLILFGLSKWSFFGMTFEHYIDAYITFSVIPLLVLTCSWGYYSLFGDFRLAQHAFVKGCIGFLTALLIFVTWDYIFKHISFHLITMVCMSLLLTCLFIDDPNSMRSLNRLKKRTNNNNKP